MYEIVRRRGCEGKLQAIGAGYKRFIDAAHHVDLRPLSELLLAPDDRVVEHVVAQRLEAAFEHGRVTGVEYQHVTLCQHRHATTCIPAFNQSINFITLKLQNKYRPIFLRKSSCR